MATRPDVQTQRLPRVELAQFLPSQRAIKAFEAVQQDVAEVLPDATEQAAAAAEAAQSSADAAQDTADGAVIAAATAQARADAAYDLAGGADSQPSLWVLHAEIQQLRARVAALEQGTTA